MPLETQGSFPSFPTWPLPLRRTRHCRLFPLLRPYYSYIWKSLCLPHKATATTMPPTCPLLLEVQGARTDPSWLQSIPVHRMPQVGTRAYGPQLPHPQGSTGDMGEEWRVGKGSRRLGDEQENPPGEVDGRPQDMGRGTQYPERSMGDHNPFHAPSIPSHWLPQPH